ncbi:hypothetical protein JTB14_011472 [Gonioctena quinquepunctata]|nr:hypothetical protein JTB14_011472 [Gonioctena quinquepunctata]
MKTILHILLFLAGTHDIIGQKCQSKDYGNGGTVCVCNAEHCDVVESVEKVDPHFYVSYTSNKAGLRFEKELGEFQTVKEALKNVITIKREKHYQKILGWGGAFTDAAGININSLDDRVSEKLMRSYFSKEGIEYSLCRVPIGATDFSTHPYSYHDEEDDNLSNFKLAQEDYELKIPLIRKATNLTGNNLKLFASAWVAPKWMKTNGAYAGIFGFLKQTKFQVWADYFIKFLDEYKKENITFWGLTTGNEPSLAWVNSAIPSVAWTTWRMQSWISNNLGPSIRNSSHSDINIMALDDQRLFLPFVDKILTDENVSNYIDGIAVHWYLDIASPKLLADIHEKYPNKFILGTEACEGSNLGEQHVIMGSWKRAEDYATDIIQDVNYWVSGWLDWNMALDTTGGPTYINNNVDSPIIVNATSGEFYKQPTFYAIGHFSKFIPRGSVRIFSNQFDTEVPVSAFRRPDGGVVVVILNKNDHPVSGKIVDTQRGEMKFNVSSHSLTNVLYW